MKIFSFPTFNLTKVLYTAEELGQSYDLQLFSPTKMEHKSPEHLARHPLGKVPVLEYNGEFFYESNNLCRLLAEINSNRLYGDTPVARAHVNQWLDFFSQHIGQQMIVFAWQEGVKPAYFGGETDPEAINEANKILTQQLPVVDKTLADREFLAANHLTIADTVAFALCQIQSFTSLDLTGYSNISRWYEHMSHRPATEKALAKLPGRAIFEFLAKD